MSEPIQITLFLAPRGARARTRRLGGHRYGSACERYTIEPTAIARAARERVAHWRVLRWPGGRHVLAAKTLRDALRALAEVDPSVETTGDKRRKRR